MKTLTVRQPWASLIAAGVKTIETRSWSTKYRGPLAIHAGLSFHPFHDAHARLVSAGVAPMDALVACSSRRTDIVPRGAVVATCTLADVVPIVELAHEHDTPDVFPCIQANSPIPGAVSHWTCSAEPSGAGLAFRPAGPLVSYVPRQLPFGDFTPGRYAYLLTDITPLTEPVPAKGRHGLWDWDSGELG